MQNQDRLLSLDFFRGLTIAGMILVNNPGSWSNVYGPLLHAKWHGWTPTDLIFPFFLFIVGVSISLALAGKKERNEPKGELYKKIIRRTLLLFGLGLFLSGFPFFDLSTIRIPGVLQRIAICYFIATVIFLHGSFKTQVVWMLVFMFVYWLGMMFIPVPEIGAGLYDKGANFAAYLDSILLKGHMWSFTKTWDPEGVFSTLPAISTTLAGVLTGHLLRSNRDKKDKALIMLVAGNIALVVGLFWNYWLPINKNLWTSSYTVFMAGMALLFLGVSYYFIDIKGWRSWTKPFRVYGMNAITVFVLSGVVAKTFNLIKWQSGNDVISLKTWIVQTFFMSWLSPVNASLAYALCFIGVSYLAMYYLYKKNIFIKV